MERYGIEVSDEDSRSIADQIREGRALKLGHHGRSTSIYLITIQGLDAVIVYNRKVKSVITFLPLQWEKR